MVPVLVYMKKLNIITIPLKHVSDDLNKRLSELVL